MKESEKESEMGSREGSLKNSCHCCLQSVPFFSLFPHDAGMEACITWTRRERGMRIVVYA